MACRKETDEKGKYRIEGMIEDYEKGIIRCMTCERTTTNPKGETDSMAESFLKIFDYSKQTIGFYKVDNFGKIPIYACEVCADAEIWSLSKKEKEKLKVAEAKIN